MFLDRKGYLEETWFTFSLSPIRDETGQVAGLFLPVTETTGGMLAERRTRALRDLASRAGRARSVQQATALSMEAVSSFALDLPFVLLYLVGEDGHARLAGHAGLEPGHAASPAIVDLDAPSDGWALADVVRSGEPRHVHDLVARFGALEAGPHGESLEQALLLPLTPPGAERPAGVLVAGVSTRLPLDETYRGFFDLVAQGVTSALANAMASEQERERVEALEEIDRAKTAFFSNVSHEFRTPLTLMLGPLEDELAAADAALEPVRRERLEAAHRNSLRLLRLVNSLLDFSRIESGRLEADYVPTDLATYTADLASLFRSATERAGLELVVECEPLPEPLLVDREMWEKVVLNLLSNAFKHTFEGAITVTLRWCGDHAELSVADTGVGIAAEQLPRLFERFHRVKAAQSRTFEGTGIGLALVRELARLHGGDVAVRSEEGHGSTFTVSVRAGRAHLPSDQVHDAGVAAQASGAAAAHVDEAVQWIARDSLAVVAEADDGPQPDFSRAESRERVLLADDNADMRRHITRLLASRFDVVAVPDGAAALDAVRAAPPDLVLTDAMMPRLDGFGLLAALRADERTRTIPVIMLSARAGEEAAVEGLNAGADDYLAKPFTAQELIARVSGCLALAGLRRESVQQLEAVNRQLAATTLAKSQFLAMMSHEIRTPMNGVIGLTSLLMDTDLEPRQREYAEGVRRSGEALLAIINDILDFSKIEASRLDLEVIDFDLRTVVEDVGDLLAEMAHVKGLELVTLLPPETPTAVQGDPGRLRQILTNLVANAIKFTERGEVVVRVDVVDENAGEVLVRFEVADTGIGIAASAQTAIFEPFAQGDSSTTRSHGGTGLGLAISKQLVECMGGEMELDSEPGRGSHFSFTVPLREQPDQTTDLPRKRAQLSGLRVLIVDDNTTNRHILEHQVAAWGMDSGSADSGPAALEMLRDARQRWKAIRRRAAGHADARHGRPRARARDPRRACPDDAARPAHLLGGARLDRRGPAGGLLRLPHQAGAAVPALRRARDGARGRNGCRAARDPAHDLRGPGSFASPRARGRGQRVQPDGGGRDAREARLPSRRGGQRARGGRRRRAASTTARC